jgi:putative phosphoesterase
VKTPLHEQTATLAIGEGGRLRIAVIADTHSAPHRAAPRHIRAWSPDAILHAGDIGDPKTALDPFAAIAPMHVVRGNIDGRAHFPDVVVLDVERDGAKVLRILLMHIAVNGPMLRADALRLAKSRGADLVICGHSHVPFIGRDRGVAVFNPGSVGPRRFSLPIVYGTIEIDPKGVRFAHVAAETGAAWLPGELPHVP